LPPLFFLACFRASSAVGYVLCHYHGAFVQNVSCMFWRCDTLFRCWF
jgi:hypothetical protein